MLRLLTGPGCRDCSGLSRRDFLRVGALGVAGLTLPGLLRARALAAAGDRHDFVRDKSVVLLYLSGGASHIETFNPNMDAPAPYRSLTGEVKTSLPGVTFGGTFPMLAKWAHKMAVVRSFRHPIADHEAAHLHVLSGGTDPQGKGAEGFSIGAAYARLRGSSHPVTGMPTFSLLTQSEVDGQYLKEADRVVKGSAPNSLGPGYAPFRHVSGEDDVAGGKGRNRTRSPAASSVADDMTLRLEAGRLEDRRSLLESLDTLRRNVDAGGSVAASDKYRRQAFDLILGSASEAFDLSKEDPRVVERYDTRSMKVGHKQFRPSTLGCQMLLARRLCEAGCGFVTVHSAGWDMHADVNNPGMVDGMNMLGRALDKSVSAFLEDLEQRGMSERVLLVITGDFGRTPKVNPNGGRDHWANLGTLAFAGGGLKVGQVVGRSDRNNGEPATDPVTPQMMMATILHTLFDIGQLRVARGLPRELTSVVEKAQPIRELF
jgi:uncharacterized protein (DUF1501 family)